MTSLALQVIILIAKILVQVLLVILGPALVFKVLKKDLPFGAAFSASILAILLPCLTYVNNLELSRALLTYAAWGAPGVSNVNLLSWTFTCGAVAAFLYAAGLLVFCRNKKTIRLTIAFTALGYLLNFGAQVVVPVVFLKGFGAGMAEDDLPFLLVTLVLSVAVCIYTGLANSVRNTYTQLETD